MNKYELFMHFYRCFASPVAYYFIALTQDGQDIPETVAKKIVTAAPKKVLL